MPFEKTQSEKSEPLMPKVKTANIEGNGDSLNPTQKAAVNVHRQIYKTFRAKYNADRKWYDRFADFMTDRLGTMSFLIVNMMFFAIWMIWNLGFIPGLPVFDLYPYNFLTMVVSLEAIFLSVIVLISQKRQATIADMREEIDFNVNIRSEHEITKILVLLDKIHDHLGMHNEEDAELNDMKKDMDLEALEGEIEQEFKHQK